MTTTFTPEDVLAALALACERGAPEKNILFHAGLAGRLESAECRRCGRIIVRYSDKTKWWHVDDDQHIAAEFAASRGMPGLVAYSRGCRSASYHHEPRSGYDEALPTSWTAAP